MRARNVRDEKVLTLEEAIRKMTSLPAARMHFQDRGIVRIGMAADLVAFDPATVRELVAILHAAGRTPEARTLARAGMEEVFQAGKPEAQGGGPARLTRSPSALRPRRGTC